MPFDDMIRTGEIAIYITKGESLVVDDV